MIVMRVVLGEKGEGGIARREERKGAKGLIVSW